MKITTWNVAGLRALLRKDGWDWVQAYQPDIIGLQEIKALPEQLDDEDHQRFREYQPTWNPAEKKGYSGTLLLVRDIPVKVTTGFGIDQFDQEGRTIRADFDDFTLFNLYVPNGGRDLKRVPFKLEYYRVLLDLCDEIQRSGQEVIISGDMNTAHQEIDVHNPATKHKLTGFLPEERAWISQFIDHGFVDVYRELYPDTIQYTYWSYLQNQRRKNQGWRLDYFLVSEGFRSKVKDVEVHQEVMGSDHCPVTLVLDR